MSFIFSLSGKTRVVSRSLMVVVVLLAGLTLCGCDTENYEEAETVQHPAGFDVESFVEAAGMGEYDTVFTMIKNGADVNAKNSKGQTALMRAVYNRQQDVVRLLLTHKANPEIRTPTGNSVLVNAARVGDRGIVELLLDAGVDINEKDADPADVTAINIAAYRENVQVFNLLLERGADYSTPSATGFTPLLSAVKSGNLAITRKLLAKGADLEYKTKSGQTALTIARQNNHQAMVNLLERAGARE